MFLSTKSGILCQMFVLHLLKLSYMVFVLYSINNGVLHCWLYRLNHFCISRTNPSWWWCILHMYFVGNFCTYIHKGYWSVNSVWSVKYLGNSVPVFILWFAWCHKAAVHSTAEVAASWSWFVAIQCFFFFNSVVSVVASDIKTPKYQLYNVLGIIPAPLACPIIYF